MNGKAFPANFEFLFLPGGAPPNSFSRSSNNFKLVLSFGNGDVGFALCLTIINCAEQHCCKLNALTTGTNLP